MNDKKCFAYVSSWSHHESVSGLCAYEFDTKSGKLSFIKCIDDKTDFNVSIVDDQRQILYALDESVDLPGEKGGGGRVFAYKLDSETGNIELLGCVNTGCASPSFLALDAGRKHLLVSNNGGKSYVTKLVRDACGRLVPSVEYDDSTVELFAVNENGSIGQLLDAAWHHGSGPDPKRQSSPHPHSVVMSPSGKLFAVCDKGNDHIYMYMVNRQKNCLELGCQPYMCEPGSQPRYSVFHPSAPYFYHNNECTTELCAYRYFEDGRLEPTGRSSALLPENQGKGKYEQQGLCITADGNYIYDIIRENSPKDKQWKKNADGSNISEGCEIVAVFKTDPESGALELIQNVKLNVFWARGCTLSPDGKFLAVCGMRSGNVLVYSVGENGKLKDTGFSVEQPSAGYISFFRA